MSRIFDALQRAEDERRGVTTASRRAATELLERAEHQASIQPNADSRGAAIVETTLVNGEAKQLAAKSSLGINSHPKSESPRSVPLEIQALHLISPFDEKLVALADRSSPAAEAFRLLCVRLRHTRKDRSLTTLLISSTTPEEGKSFTAANLACTLATGTQQNVLLIEGDIRRPSQGHLFHLQAMPGLCEYLRGERKLTESLYRLEEAGIWFLPAGRQSGASHELLDSAKLSSMMAQLTRWFDWIIIDSSPVLPLADTSVLEKLADGVLLVTRRGFTAKRKLQRGIDAIDQTKLIGAILNSSTRSAEEDYYYYGGRPADPDDAGASGR